MYGKLKDTGDGTWAVDTPYDPVKKEAIKALPGARWDKPRRVWGVSVADNTLLELVEALDGLDVAIPRHILERAVTLAHEQAAGESQDDLDDRLFPFQVEGVRWLQKRTTALLGDEMGLGKTIQVLQALPADAPVVAVVPATLKHNWVREIESWAPSFKATVLAGRKSFRWPEPGEIVITNYEILPKHDDKEGAGKALLAQCPQGLVLIADEVQKAKNKKAQRTLRLRAIKDAAQEREGRVWVMTGTPLLNNPFDLWGVLESGGLGEESFTHFGKFFRAMGGYKKQIWTGVKTQDVVQWGTPQPTAPKMLGRVMLRRTREEVLPELPGKTHRAVLVNNLDLSGEEKKMLRRGLKALDNAMDAFEDMGDQPIPAFEEMSECKAALAKAKVPALLSLVEDYEENEEPVVVFSDHLAPIHALGEREGWTTITGGTPNAKRQDIVEAFQAGEYKGLALTIPAGNYGLTLTKASHMVFCDLNWVPANNVQAEDRICRIGQDRGCQYTTLVAKDALDERIHGILAQKTALIARTVHNTSDINPSTVRLGDAQVERFRGILERQMAAQAEQALVDEQARQEREARQADPNAVRCPTCQKVLEVAICSPRSKHHGRPYYSCRPCDFFQWADVEPQDEELRTWVHNALRYLASRCDGAVEDDGVGFNGTDTGFGKSLAMRDRLTDKMVTSARKMLVKYQGQLAQGGHWPPPDWQESERQFKVRFKKNGRQAYKILVGEVVEGNISKLDLDYWQARFLPDSTFTFESDSRELEIRLLKNVKAEVKRVIEMRKEAQNGSGQ